MGDSGEGLIDIDARLQELADERDAARRDRLNPPEKIDPERAREMDSLRLATSELHRQFETTEHPMRRKQLQAAIEEVAKRLAAMQVEPKPKLAPKPAPAAAKAPARLTKPVAAKVQKPVAKIQKPVAKPAAKAPAPAKAAPKKATAKKAAAKKPAAKAKKR